ncbi:hypothetical protein ACUOCP_52105, partial [Escherichia sp. R-CC3]
TPALYDICGKSGIKSSLKASMTIGAWLGVFFLFVTSAFADRELLIPDLPLHMLLHLLCMIFVVNQVSKVPYQRKHL